MTPSNDVPPATSPAANSSRGVLPQIVMVVVLLFSGSTIGAVGKVVVVVVGNLASTAQGYSGRIGRDISWQRVLWESALWSGFWLALVFASRVGDWIGFALGLVVLVSLFAKAMRSTGAEQSVPPSAP